MGSLEEETLWQMVHDFIESEPTTTATTSLFLHQSNPNQSTTPLNHKTRCFTLQEILRENTESEAQILHRIGIHIRKKMEMEKTTKLKRWLAMCLKRDGFDASLCLTSWISAPGCPSGNYEYIDIIGGGKRVIVDIDFKSQFEVARPTKCYTELSSHLPHIFVGGEEKLRQVVRVMCIAAEESMKERGLHIPPWRKYVYMNSKWLSSCKREEEEEVTLKDEVASKRDPLSHIVRVKPMRGEMGGAQRRRSTALSGSALSNHFADMGIIY